MYSNDIHTHSCTQSMVSLLTAQRKYSHYDDKKSERPLFEKNGAIFKRASKVIQDRNGFTSLRFAISLKLAQFTQPCKCKLNQSQLLNLLVTTVKAASWVLLRILTASL